MEPVFFCVRAKFEYELLKGYTSSMEYVYLLGQLLWDCVKLRRTLTELDSGNPPGLHADF